MQHRVTDTEQGRRTEPPLDPAVQTRSRIARCLRLLFSGWGISFFIVVLLIACGIGVKTGHLNRPYYENTSGPAVINNLTTDTVLIALVRPERSSTPGYVTSLNVLPPGQSVNVDLDPASLGPDEFCPGDDVWIGPLPPETTVDYEQFDPSSQPALEIALADVPGADNMSLISIPSCVENRTYIIDYAG